MKVIPGSNVSPLRNNGQPSERVTPERELVLVDRLENRAPTEILTACKEHGLQIYAITQTFDGYLLHCITRGIRGAALTFCLEPENREEHSIAERIAHALQNKWQMLRQTEQLIR